MTAMCLNSGFAGSRQCLAGGLADRGTCLRRVCHRPSIVRATAQTEEQTEQAQQTQQTQQPLQPQQTDDNRPKLTFGTNANAARGYTEEDSAGQSNIFAVEPRQYVQGSNRDSSGSSGTVGAVVAAVVALGVVVAGLIAIQGRGSESKLPAPLVTVQEETSSLRSLSTFKQQFGSAPAVQQ